MRLVDLIREINARPVNTDTIDRHTAAQMLDVHFRTLQRWHHAGYGPPREPSRRRVAYSRAEVEQWIAEHPPEKA
jgi:hypothetical protein